MEILNNSQFVLIQAFGSSDLTVKVRNRYKTQTSIVSIGGLNKDRAGTLQTKGTLYVEQKDNSGIYERIRFNGVTDDGLDENSFRNFTLTLEIASDLSTVMRGLANDDDGTNNVLNVIAANKFTGEFKINSPCRIAVSTAEYSVLESTFLAGTVDVTAEAGENLLDKDTVSIHTDEKLYKYHATNFPNLMGIVQGAFSVTQTATYKTFGGLSQGHIGLTAGATQYAENTGATTEVSSSTTDIIGKADTTTSIRIFGTTESNQIATQGEAEAGVDNEKMMTPLRTKEAIDFQVTSNSEITDTARESLTSIEPACIYKLFPTTDPEIINVISTPTTTTDKYRATKLYGNGVSASSVTLVLSRGVLAPSNPLNIRIETDNAGKPSGTLADANATSTILGASLTTVATPTNLNFAGAFTLNDNQLYWLVLESPNRIVNQAYFIGSVGATYSQQIEGTLSYSNEKNVALACDFLGAYKDGLIKLTYLAPVTDFSTGLIGFAKNSISAGSTGNLLMTGIINGFSGLEKGGYYEFVNGVLTRKSSSSSFRAINSTSIAILTI